MDSAKTLPQDKPIERDEIPTTAMDLLKDDKSDIINNLPKLPFPNEMTLPNFLSGVKHHFLDEALDKHNGNAAQAAIELGITDKLCQKWVRDRNKK